MPEITYRGEDRIIEFQIKDANAVPVNYTTIIEIVLVFFYERDKIISRWCKSPGITNFEQITEITDAPNGIFQIHLMDEVISKVDPSRTLRWEMKTTIEDLESPDNEFDCISRGELTDIEEGITRNIKLT